MPVDVAALLDVFDNLNLGIELLGMPLSCLQLDSFFNELLFLVLSPCVLGIIVLACSMSAEVLTKRTASLKAGVIRALPYLLFLAFYAFPIVSARAFQAFDCEEFDDDTRFLRADYSLDCSDAAEYARVISLAWVAIAVYAVCISLLYLTLLLTARKAILMEQPTDLSRSLTFLHQDYKPWMYWWEVVETCKKVRYTPPAALFSPLLRASYPVLLISLLSF